MAFFASAIDTLKILVIALGAGLGAAGDDGRSAAPQPAGRARTGPVARQRADHAAGRVRHCLRLQGRHADAAEGRAAGRHLPLIREWFARAEQAPHVEPQRTMRIGGFGFEPPNGGCPRQ